MDGFYHEGHLSHGQDQSTVLDCISGLEPLNVNMFTLGKQNVFLEMRHGANVI